MNTNNTVSRSPELIASNIDGQIVMMSIESSAYYNLDNIGSEIWQLLEAPMKIAEICETLMGRYAVDANTCQRDVLHFIERLANEGVLVLID